MLTCACPARGSARPSARTPGKPPPRSRTASAIPRATSTSSLARSTLNAIIGRLARVDPPLELARAAAPEERRAASRCRISVEENRQLELGADPGRDGERTG